MHMAWAETLIKQSVMQSLREGLAGNERGGGLGFTVTGDRQQVAAVSRPSCRPYGPSSSRICWVINFARRRRRRQRRRHCRRQRQSQRQRRNVNSGGGSWSGLVGLVCLCRRSSSCFFVSESVLKFLVYAHGCHSGTNVPKTGAFCILQ